MKFKKEELIKQIDARIEKLEKHAESRNKQAEEAAAKAREEWLKDRLHWLKFANTIRQKISKHRPITADDIPKELLDGRYSDNQIAIFRPKARDKYTANTTELEDMKTALNTVADEYITTAGLKELGFKNLRGLF